MAAEGQPVNQSGYHCGVLKQIRPLGEWQICGHNGAALFASVGDDLKQQFRLVPVEAEIAQLSRISKSALASVRSSLPRW